MAWGKAFGFYVVTATRSGKVLAWAAGPRNRSASCAGPAQPTWWRQSRGAWDPKGGRIIGHPSPTATDTWPKQSVRSATEAPKHGQNNVHGPVSHRTTAPSSTARARLEHGLIRTLPHAAGSSAHHRKGHTGNMKRVTTMGHRSRRDDGEAPVRIDNNNNNNNDWSSTSYVKRRPTCHPWC